MAHRRLHEKRQGYRYGTDGDRTVTDSGQQFSPPSTTEPETSFCAHPLARKAPAANTVWRNASLLTRRNLSPTVGPRCQRCLPAPELCAPRRQCVGGHGPRGAPGDTRERYVIQMDRHGIFQTRGRLLAAQGDTRWPRSLSRVTTSQRVLHEPAGIHRCGHELQAVLPGLRRQ